MSEPRSQNYPTPVESADRPSSVPQPGLVAPFDAGWDAHAAGITRQCVRAIARDPGWALLGWDARETVAAAVLGVPRPKEEQ